MYVKYFELSEPPFQNTADQRFLWPGEKHREALAAMRYGIFQNKGFVLLTGDVGTGKTTLVNALVQDIEDGIAVASISDPGLSKAGFLKSLWKLFDIPGDWSGMELYHRHRQSVSSDQSTGPNCTAHLRRSGLG